MRRIPSIISGILLSIGLGIIAGVVIKSALKGLVDALDGIDEIAQRQSARHAYGPLVQTKTPDFIEQPDDDDDATSFNFDDDLSQHRYAPGVRPWDDEVLDRFDPRVVDPLNTVIDDPFAENGLLVQPPMHGTILRGGGHLESDV